jgi:hypothetical protein
MRVSLLSRTPDGAALTTRHRSEQLALKDVLLGDLVGMWAGVIPTALAATVSGFAEAVAELIGERHNQSSLLARRYFMEFRSVEGIPGSTRARSAGRLSRLAIVRAIRGAAVNGIINARRRGFSIQAATRNGLTAVNGSATTLVLTGGRESILRSIEDDRRADGWQRVTGSDPCSFCAMIASRGAVFGTRGSADFQAHDHDSCEPEPFYEGSRMPARNEEFRDLWRRATRGLSGTDALNAFRRAREGRVAPGDPLAPDND